LGRAPSVKKRTARAALERGLFGRLPSPTMIDRLVDFHVAHSADEAKLGRGFDYAQMQRDFAPAWQPRWFRSYSFMGTQYEATLPVAWQQTCRDLAEKYPQDGANFCAVWQRGQADSSRS
jgi:hypothetical protein